jgi:hypothetical protein
MKEETLMPERSRPMSALEAQLGERSESDGERSTQRVVRFNTIMTGQERLHPFTNKGESDSFFLLIRWSHPNLSGVYRDNCSSKQLRRIVSEDVQCDNSLLPGWEIHQPYDS